MPEIAQHDGQEFWILPRIRIYVCKLLRHKFQSQKSSCTVQKQTNAIHLQQKTRENSFAHDTLERHLLIVTLGVLVLGNELVNVSSGDHEVAVLFDQRATKVVRRVLVVLCAEVQHTARSFAVRDTWKTMSGEALERCHQEADKFSHETDQWVMETPTEGMDTNRLES